MIVRTWCGDLSVTKTERERRVESKADVLVGETSVDGDILLSEHQCALYAAFYDQGKRESPCRGQLRCCDRRREKMDRWTSIAD
jgi:hypothetical protein